MLLMRRAQELGNLQPPCLASRHSAVRCVLKRKSASLVLLMGMRLCRGFLSKVNTVGNCLEFRAWQHAQLQCILVSAWPEAHLDGLQHSALRDDDAVQSGNSFLYRLFIQNKALL